MQWRAEPGAGFSEANPADLWVSLIDDEIYGYQKVNVAAQMAEPNSLFYVMKHMIATRKAHSVLGWGGCDFLPVVNKAVLAYLRRSEQDQMLIICNLSDQPQETTVSLPDLVGVTPRDVLSDKSLEPIADVDYLLTLAPYQYYWLTFSTT